MNNETVRIGIISFAHMHAYAYAECLGRIEGVELVAVADDNDARGQSAAKRFGVAHFHDYEDLVKQDLDAVIVCSENARHADHVTAAAESGLAVLCEKPISTNLEGGQRMIDVCANRGVHLHIAFPSRYAPAVSRGKHLVDAGELGRIVSLTGTNRGQNPGGWFVDPTLSGGGAIIDHTVHIVDLMRWYTGSEVKEVYAEVDTRFTNLDVDDCGLLMLEFDNGVFASHDPSWSRCKTFPTWGDVTLQVIGTAGVTRVDAFGQHAWRYDAASHAKHEMWGDDMDFLMVQDFVQRVRAGLAPAIRGEDGLRATEVAIGAYESARTGRPVRLRDLANVGSAR